MNGAPILLSLGLRGTTYVENWETARDRERRACLNGAQKAFDQRHGLGPHYR